MRRYGGKLLLDHVDKKAGESNNYLINWGVLSFTFSFWGFDAEFPSAWLIPL